MIYKITIFGLLIINLINWLDGVLTYIGLYIIPKGFFYESNLVALQMFNNIGFFSSFIFKICFFGVVTLFIFLLIHYKKSTGAFINIMVGYYFIILIMFLQIVFEWNLYLIQYYV